MKALACVAVLTTVGLAQADTTSDLRNRCAEQERQIVALEKKIESLHSDLALERRRARGAEAPSPPSTAAPSAPSTGSGTTYKVQDGDTLSSIARRYKTSSIVLMKDNGIADPTRLRVGQSLKISGAATPGVELAEAPAPKPAPAESKKADSPVYKVQSGDTFYKIARNHSLTVAKLEELNPKIDPARIIIGQSLTVAGSPPAGPSLAPSGTRTISTPAPAPKEPAAKKEAPKSPAPQPAAKKEAPKPAAAAKPEPKPTAAAKPDPKPAAKTISSIIVMEEISFEKFAEKHGSTTEQLNVLNGLSLKDSTVLAKGSELYVPGR